MIARLMKLWVCLFVFLLIVSFAITQKASAEVLYRVTATLVFDTEAKAIQWAGCHQRESLAGKRFRHVPCVGGS